MEADEGSAAADSDQTDSQSAKDFWTILREGDRGAGDLKPQANDLKRCLKKDEFSR